MNYYSKFKSPNRMEMEGYAHAIMLKVLCKENATLNTSKERR